MSEYIKIIIYIHPEYTDKDNSLIKVYSPKNLNKLYLGYYLALACKQIQKELLEMEV